MRQLSLLFALFVLALGCKPIDSSQATGHSPTISPALPRQLKAALPHQFPTLQDRLAKVDYVKQARNRNVTPKRALKAVGPDISTYPSPAWATPKWFVSPTGNDNNTGTDAAHPLRHVRQIYSRWGTTSPALVQVTQIFLLGDLDPDDPVNVICTASNAVFGDIEVIGTNGITIPLSGTFLTATNMNRSAPPPFGTLPTVTIAGDASAFLGFQILDTTAGAVAWIIRVTGGGHTLTLSPTMTAQTYPSGPFVSPPAELTIAPGDSYQIRQLPKAGIIGLGGGFTCSGYEQDIDTHNGGVINSPVLFTSQAATAPSQGPTSAFVDIENSLVIDGSTIAGGGFILGGTMEHGVTISPFDHQGLMVDGDLAPIEPFTVTSGALVYGAIHEPVTGGYVTFPGTEVGATASGFGPPNGMLWGDSPGSGGAASIIVGGEWTYNGTAVATLLGNPNFELGSAGHFDNRGYALDLDVNPAQWYGPRSITPAHMDAAIGGISGVGFAGIALNPELPAMLASVTALQLVHTPNPYFNSGAGVTVHQDTPGVGQITFTSP